MQQHQGALVEETFEPGGGRRRIIGERQSQRQTARGRLQIRLLGIEQQARGQTADQGMTGRALGETHQRLRPRLLELRVLKQTQRAVGTLDGRTHGAGGLVVERRAGAGQRERGARHQPGEDMSHQTAVGLAHVAVAQDRGQRRNGAQHLGHVAGDGGLILQTARHRHDGRLQIREQQTIDQFAQGRQRVGVFGGIDDAAGGGFLDAVTPAAGLDDGQRVPRLPLQRPDLVEGALDRAPGALHFAPVDPEQRQTVQQVTARQIRGFAQVEIERLAARLRFQAHRALALGDVTLQGHDRGLLRDASQPLADDERAMDEPQRRLLALADDRAQRLVEFVETGLRTLAHGRQRIGQPHGLDQMGR